MKKDTVIALKKPEVSIEDPLTEVIRRGAKQLLIQALEAEIASFLKLHEHVCDEDGKRQVTRNGYMRERTVQTGIGDIEVRAPRAADRRKSGGAKIRFTSSILPPYLRRSKNIEEMLPWLYLKGITTGDFGEALAALLGKNAPGLSSSTISRLKEVWQGELKEWQQRSLRPQANR
jgi:putative transposase